MLNHLTVKESSISIMPADDTMKVSRTTAVAFVLDAAEHSSYAKEHTAHSTAAATILSAGI